MYKVAVIGECMVELFQNEEGLYKQTFGGDTLNCSVYLKRSLKEAVVEYITVLGEETLSTQMLDFFHNEEVKTTYIDRLSDKNAGLYIIHTKEGERSFSYWRSDSAAKKLFLTNSFEKMKSDLVEFDLIYLSAITLAIMSEQGRKNLYEVLDIARKKGVKVAYDSNYRPRLYDSKESAKSLHVEALKYCDIYLPSYDDEKELWGDIGIEEVVKKANCSEIVIKRGEDGVFYSLNGKSAQIEIRKIDKVVDSTSAGDSFNGAYLAARLEKLGIKESIKKASRLARKVIMHKGAIIPKEKYD